MKGGEFAIEIEEDQAAVMLLDGFVEGGKGLVRGSEGGMGHREVEGLNVMTAGELFQFGGDGACFLHRSRAGKAVDQEGDGGTVAWTNPAGGAHLLESDGGFAVFEADLAFDEVRHGEVGGGFSGPLAEFKRGIPLPAKEENAGLGDGDGDGEGVEPAGDLDVLVRVIEAALGSETGDGKTVVGGGGAGVELESAVEVGFGAGPVPVPEAVDGAERGVGFGEAFVEFEGPEGGLAGDGETGRRRGEPEAGHDGVGVGEAAVGKGVVGIERDGAAVVVYALAEAFGGELVPGVAALEVEGVGFEVAGGPADESGDGPAGFEVGPGFVGDGAGDLILNLENIL